MGTTTTETTARVLTSILQLSEAVNDPPYTDSKVKEIIGRMAKGGWGICAVGTCTLGYRKIYSVTFYQLEGEEEIHVTSENSIVAAFEAALKEAHRRYFARVQSQPGDAGRSG